MMTTKHHLSILFTMIMMASTAWSQDLIQFPAPSLQLKMEGNGGKNGAAVAYNPVNKVYYAVIAGNSTYPLEAFYENGRHVSTAEAYNDMRGMWWNPKAKALEGNCYADGGIVSIGLKSDGMPGAGNMVIFPGGSHQPGEHAVGTIDSKAKEILYYSEGIVVGYNRKDGSPTSTFLMLGLPVDETDINWSTLLYTGVKNRELGLLDYYSGKVYLFSRKDGSLTGIVNLPTSAPTYEAFNVSYANGHVFLFDQDSRTWIGYRIF